jgi:hypothetical protein
VGDDKRRALFDDLPHLAIDTPLLVHLGPITPDMRRAFATFENGDVEEFQRAMARLVAAADSPSRRRDLAHLVLKLRDEGDISAELAAVAVIDLSYQASLLFLAVVAASLAEVADTAEILTPAP